MTTTNQPSDAAKAIWRDARTAAANNGMKILTCPAKAEDAAAHVIDIYTRADRHLTPSEPVEELAALSAKAMPGIWEVDGQPDNQIIWSAPETRVCFMAHSDGQDIERDRATPAFIVALVNAYRSGALLATPPAPVNSDAGLVEALTPSGATKAAYHGEFSFSLRRVDELGEEYSEKVYVPWTTVKQIMAAIRERAALSRAKGEAA